MTNNQRRMFGATRAAGERKWKTLAKAGGLAARMGAMRIVFASLGSLGDLHPLLALAEECERRGHEAAVAASPCFLEYLGSLGFEGIPLRPNIEARLPVVRRLTHPRLGPQRLLSEWVFSAVGETYEDLLEAARGADFLVVGELLYVAPLVAAKTGIRWANAILSPTSFLSTDDPCVLAPLPFAHTFLRLGKWPHRAALAVGRQWSESWAKPLRALERELGVRPMANPVFEGKHSPHLVLALFPEFFASAQADWPRGVTQTGFPFFRQPVEPAAREEIGNFLAGGAPPILFTLGSAMVHIAGDFYGQAAEAAGDLGRRAVLLLGPNPAPPNLPANVLALPYAPLELAAPGAAAIVHHGGIGTCGMALRSGIPSLAIPFGYDQPDNAERLRRLGVGRLLPRRRVSRHSLVENLGRLLEDAAMAARAKELAEKVRPAEDLERTVSAIEAAAAGMDADGPLRGTVPAGKPQPKTE